MGATLLGIRIRSDCVCLESSLQIIGGCCAGTVVILQTGGRETRGMYDSSQLRYFEPLRNPLRAICLSFPAQLLW